MTMSPTSAMASIFGDKTKQKTVQFGGSVDWEEENLRSCRGLESRKRRKEGKTARQQQEKQLLQAVLDILREGQFEDQIVKICGSEDFGFATQCLILAIIEGVENVGVEGEGDNEEESEIGEEELRRLLQDFRSSQNQARIESLDETDLRCLNCLTICPLFTKEFGSLLAVTSASGYSDNTLEHSAKRQRQGQQVGFRLGHAGGPSAGDGKNDEQN